MIRFYAILCCFLFSCAIRIDYMGNSYPRTSSLEVFVDEGNISKPYTIIGKGYVSFPAGESGDMEIVQKKAIKKGLENGADAVLFVDQFLTGNGLSVNTVSHTDSVHKGLRTSRSTTAVPLVITHMEIIYLKYK